MASLSTDAKGPKLRFEDSKGARRTLRLTGVSQTKREEIKRHVELIVAAQIERKAPPVSTSQWIAEQSDKLRKHLAKFELTEWTEPTAETLKAYLDRYVANRGDVKRSTATVYGHTRRCLVEFFGADRPIKAITAADAARWRRWLTVTSFPRSHGRKGGKLSDSTIRRRCAIARQFFGEAIDDRLIAENPFGKLKGIGVKANPKRDYFVTREEAAKVLDACPDAEWRLLFALSRFAGLRCPSEHLALTWGDVDWTAGRMVVHSPKTAHHEGKDSRVIPIFTDLRPYLEDARDLADECALDPSAHVIARYRSANCNLRTQLERIIKRAKLKPWPKLFQNLRASRATELAAEFPAHVAADWLGHSTLVAQKHYWRTTDADFEAASKVAHKVAQNTPASDGTEPHGFQENPEKCSISSGSQGALVGGTRLELVTSTV